MSHAHHPAPPMLQVAARPLGLVLLVVAVGMALCSPASFLMGSIRGGLLMLMSAAITAAAGGGALAWGRRTTARIGRRESLVIVALAWLAAGVFGGLPWVISGAMSPVDAFFESVSGFTTTGATILTEIEHTLDPAAHLWRTATHWLGGLGIVVLFVALFPALGVGGKHLFRTEAAGPPSGGLAPRIRDTARSLWRIYLAITVVEAGLLMLAGMSVYEAVVHSLSTMGTGGFSTRNGSIGEFDSVAIDVVITVFMIIAGVNFGLFHESLTRGWRAFWQNMELRIYLGIFVIATIVITADLTRWVYSGDVPTALRYASFQVASIITTTGLGTADFEQWPVLSQTVLVTLYFIGGSAGSTAGGLKVIRVIIVLQVIVNEARRGFRPALITPVRVGHKVVGAGIISEVLAYGALFTGTVAIGAVFVGLLEPQVDLVTAFMASLACVANVGPGLGDVGPTDNYSFFSATTKAILSVLMLVGRLEGFALLTLLVPSFWRR